jgi:hypothetical protein
VISFDVSNVPMVFISSETTLPSKFSISGTPGYPDIST